MELQVEESALIVSGVLEAPGAFDASASDPDDVEEPVEPAEVRCHDSLRDLHVREVGVRCILTGDVDRALWDVDREEREGDSGRDEGAGAL